MLTQQSQRSLQHPWLKPIGRAVLAIMMGVYGQMIIAISVWYVLGSPEQFSLAFEFGIKIALLVMECSVFILLVVDKEPLKKYINLLSPRRIIISGFLASIPLVIANRVMYGWIIRIFHGEFVYYRQLSGSNLAGVLFLLLQVGYYFFEVFVLVYAYAKLAEGLRTWRSLPRWGVVVIGGIFLFATWSLAHGFVVTSLMKFSIGLYLPFAFVLLYELAGSQLAPAITWFLFVFV